jgi:NFU1 iron-sulfur cluster scaffold homolog, mitochondrial
VLVADNVVAIGKQPEASWSELKPKIAAVIREQLRGGKIVLTKVSGGNLYIEMAGGCQGCASSQLTLRQGFERLVRRVAPEVEKIIDVTDLPRGQMPY